MNTHCTRTVVPDTSARISCRETRRKTETYHPRSAVEGKKRERVRDVPFGTMAQPSLRVEHARRVTPDVDTPLDQQWRVCDRDAWRNVEWSRL